MGPKRHDFAALICDDDSSDDSDDGLDQQILAACQQAAGMDGKKIDMSAIILQPVAPPPMRNIPLSVGANSFPPTTSTSSSSLKKRPLDSSSSSSSSYSGTYVAGDDKSKPAAKRANNSSTSAPAPMSAATATAVAGAAQTAKPLVEAKNKPGFRTIKTPRPSVRWTQEMDERLREAAGQDEKNWSKAAAHVGHGVSNDQCRCRWTDVLDPKLGNLKQHPWTEEEIEELRHYVSTHRRGQEHENKVDWTETAKLLGRTNNACQVKWTSLRQASLKTGPWTDDEDAIVLLRAKEWKATRFGTGLWIELEKELGRSSNNCNHRWKRYLLPRLHAQGIHDYDQLFSLLPADGVTHR